MFNEAANSYKKSDPDEALKCLQKSCDIYIDMVSVLRYWRETVQLAASYIYLMCLKGRLVMAAKQYQVIAELYETDIVDVKNSMAYYEKAGDLFKTEENNA